MVISHLTERAALIFIGHHHLSVRQWLTGVDSHLNHVLLFKSQSDVTGLARMDFGLTSSGKDYYFEIKAKN